MSLDMYVNFKRRFENTKPIRGRAIECRPIANRARDWEQVVKRDIDGVTAYGAHLYQTDCVVYMPNGDIRVMTGGWATPSTADFISRYIPHQMHCYKKYNKIWIEYLGNAYPIEEATPTVFSYNTTVNGYEVANPKPMHQKVVDRTKAKEARNKLEPFRKYAKIMLKLADGWVSNELVEQHAEPHGAYRDYWGRRTYKLDGQEFTGYGLSGSLSESDAHKIYTAMCTEDETLFPKLLCMICSGSNTEENRTIRTETEDYTDYQGNPQTRTHAVREYKYDYKTVDNRINFIVKKACDVYTTKEVPVGKVVTNLV